MHDGSYNGVDLSSNDIFALDGNRLFSLVGTYGQNNSTYYTESETFATITSITSGTQPDRFEVKDKNGNTLSYGSSYNSSLTGINNSTVLCWFLNEVKDEFGNYMRYSYKQLSGETVIDKIEYTGNSNVLNPYNSVTFDYIPLAEKTSYYINGVEFRKSQLLKSITSLAGTQVVKKYVLDYKWNNGTYLSSVTEVDAMGNELLPTIFCWGNPNDNAGLQNNQNTLVLSNPSDYTDLSTVAADLDGDGFSDYVCFNTPGGRERVMHNDFKNNIATNNTLQFSSIYDQTSLDHTILHLASSVTDEDKNDRQEVYSVFSDTYGYYSATVFAPAYSQSYKIIKTVVNPGGAVSVSPIGSYTTSNFYLLVFSPNQFLYDVRDYTGDGVNDILRIDPENIVLTTNSTAYNYVLPDIHSIVKPFKFNSDGMSDYIIFENTTANVVNISVITFNGSTFSSLYSTSVNFPLCSIPFTRLINFAVGDFNGDAIDDIVYLTDSRDEMYIIKGTGTGFLAPAKVVDFIPMNGPAQSDIYISANDINGDGMADIAITENSLLVPNSTVNNYYTYFSLGDLIIKGGNYTGNWTHSSVEYTYYGSTPIDLDGHVGQWQEVRNKYVTTGNNIGTADLNGDGISDITSFVSGQETTITNNINRVKEVIQEIKTPLYKKTQIKYANIHSEIYVLNPNKFEVYNKQSTTTYASPLFNYKPNMYCVRSEMEISGPGGNMSHEKRYIYSDAINHVMGRGFLGFEKITSFDEVDTHIGTVNKSTFDTQFYIPLITESASGKIVTSGTTPNGLPNYVLNSSQLISKNVNTFQLIPRNAKGYFVELTSNTTKDYLKSTQANSSYVYNLSNSGKLSSKSTLYGWGSTIKTINESYTYVLKNGYYKISNKTTDQTQAGDALYRRTVDYYYNDAQGHLTSAVNDLGAGIPTSSILTTSYSQFNDFGSPTIISVSSTNVTPARTSEVNYDPTGRFVIKEINALGDFKEHTYENIFGNIVQEKGITGLTTNYFYDGLGRLSKTILPNLAQNKITYAWDSPSNYQYSSSGPFGVYSIKTEIEANGYSKAYYFSNGELVRKETQDYSGQIVISDNNYSGVAGSGAPVGTLIQSTEPHYLSQQKYLITHYDYEPTFFRPATQTTYSTSSNNVFSAVTTGISNATTYNNPTSTDVLYSQYSVKITDQSFHAVTKKSNAAGQIINIQNDALGGYQQNAAYDYASNGQPKIITLTNTSNPGQNILYSYQYDELGQLKQKVNPSLGATNYLNDAIGEVLQESNTIGQFTYQYDLLGRVTSKAESISGTTTYQYVTNGNGKEMIDKIFGPNSTAEYKYDAFNRVIENKETLLSGGKIFKSNSVYDNYGRESQHTYPSGLITKNTFNTLGYLSSISDNSNNTIWQLVSSDAKNRITEYDYGNGINTKNTFDDLNHLSEIDHGSGTIHKQNYVFDPHTGNMTKRTFYNYVNGTTLEDVFNFDNQDRLIQSKQHDIPTNTYNNINNVVMDVLGNITHKDDAGDFSYTNTSTTPFAVQGVANPINIGHNTLNPSFTEFDKILHLSETGSNKKMDFVYGIGDKRIRMDYSNGGPSLYTRYYSDNYDRQETSSGYKEWTYIPAPNGLCAIYFNNNGSVNLNYVLSDHLGSPILLTNNTQSIVEQYSFDSWGRRRNPTDWSYNNIPVPQQMIRGYTLHEDLDELVLINMNGRIYDPVIGRFIQADNCDQDPDDLEGYNCYMYCSNNPLKYSDPTGHEEVPGTDAVIEAAFQTMSTEFYEQQNMSLYGTPDPPVYSMQGDFLDRYNAEYQVINNTQVSGIGSSKGFQGYGTIEDAPGLLTEENVSAGMMIAAHTGLDVLGMAPGIGEFADGVNAGIYAYEGDYLNAGLSAAGMIPFAGWAATGGKYLNKAVDIGITVLGHNPEYLNLAKQLDARVFDIPTKYWDEMSTAEKWQANQKFLDRTIIRGDNIMLATPLDAVKPGSYFQQELNYLFDKGYSVSTDGQWLIKH